MSSTHLSIGSFLSCPRLLVFPPCLGQHNIELQLLVSHLCQPVLSLVCRIVDSSPQCIIRRTLVQSRPIVNAIVATITRMWLDGFGNTWRMSFLHTVMSAGSEHIHKPKARYVGETYRFCELSSKPTPDEMVNVSTGFMVRTKYDHLVHTRPLSSD